MQKKQLHYRLKSAGTILWIASPGNGSKLSQRIISFHDKLGGFYRVDQIGETYGLPYSTFQKLKLRFSIGHAVLQQININTAAVEEMKIHPHLRYAIPKAIVQYRVQHGNYLVVDDVKKIMLITDDIFNKAGPYLKVHSATRLRIFRTTSSTNYFVLKVIIFTAC
jgi:competence protein ComEA